MIVGYKLIDREGVVIETWGGMWGICPAIPDKLRLPHGDVHCPSLDVDYEGFRLVVWIMDTPENETVV